MNTALNKTVVAIKANESGGDHAQGDVCIEDASNSNSVVNDTSGAYQDGGIWVCVEPAGVADGALGRYANMGYVPVINLSASADLGDLVATHTVAKEGTPHPAPIGAGDFAQVLGTGTSPEAWLFGMPNQGAGALTLIEKHIASNSATLDFVLLSDLYSDYMLKISGLVPSAAGNNLIVRFATDATPTWDAGNNYRWARLYWNQAGASGMTADGGATSNMQIGAVIAITGNVPVNGLLRLSNLRTAAQVKSIHSDVEQQISSDSNLYGLTSKGWWMDTTNKAFGIRLLMSSGNIASGIVSLYGIKD